MAAPVMMPMMGIAVNAVLDTQAEPANKVSEPRSCHLYYYIPYENGCVLISSNTQFYVLIYYVGRV